MGWIEKLGVIEKLKEPTAWVHNLVIVRKRNSINVIRLKPRYGASPINSYGKSLLSHKCFIFSAICLPYCVYTSST